MTDLSAPRAAIAVTAEDALILAGRYGAAAIVAGDSGDQSTCDRLFAEAGRFAKAATDLQNGTPGAPVLNENGVDQQGGRWVPRRVGQFLAVLVTGDELLALRSCYAEAASRAGASGEAARWVRCEVRRDDLLVQAAELDPTLITIRHHPDPKFPIARC